jgi:hypothetical protein
LSRIYNYNFTKKKKIEIKYGYLRLNPIKGNGKEINFNNRNTTFNPLNNREESNSNKLNIKRNQRDNLMIKNDRFYTNNKEKNKMNKYLLSNYDFICDYLSFHGQISRAFVVLLTL